jgi:hypothetical protein
MAMNKEAAVRTIRGRADRDIEFSSSNRDRARSPGLTDHWPPLSSA